MDLGRFGVWSGALARGDDGEARDAAAELEELGYGAMWLPGGLDAAVLDRVGPILGATRRCVVTTAILSVWAIPATEAAARHVAITDAHPGRFLLGLGISHAPLVARSGQHYARPLATMEAFLDGLDGAPVPIPAAERCLAAQGPRMLEVAARRSAGAHPYLVTPEHTARARQLLGPGVLLAPDQKVVVDRDAASARATARRALQIYLGLPNYTNNWMRLGFEPDDLANGGSDRLVDALFAWGDVADAAARVRAHLDAGADHVCVNVISDDPGVPLADFRELSATLMA